MSYAKSAFVFSASSVPPPRPLRLEKLKKREVILLDHMDKALISFLNHLLLVFALMLCLNSPSAAFAGKANPRTWLCYYGNTYGPEIYSRFDLVILDGHYHPPLPDKSQASPLIFGYVSVGEVIENGHLWPLAKDKPYLIRKNQFWNSWIVDVRDSEWQQLLFDTVIPSVLNRGFDGLFLDTFDSGLSLLNGKHGMRFRGTESALVDITAKIKKTYPDRHIAVNRGLPILPAIARNIRFVVAESLYSRYTEGKGYERVDETTQQILLQQIEAGLKINPELGILTLDYAGDSQFDLAQEAIVFSRKKGFVPYVSTYKLDQIFFHTLEGRPKNASK